MHSLAIRLLTLFAVLMLPLGMAHANSPQPQGHHAMEGMGTMSPGHCDEMAQTMPDGGNHQLPGDCAMACASMLPAMGLSAPPLSSPPPSHDLVLPGLTATLRGLTLDIATPPPRNA